MIPISIQNYTTARLSEIDSSISALVKERDELRRWLDEGTRCDVVATAAPEQEPATPVTEITYRRKRIASPVRLNGASRPTRIRGGTTDEEYLFLGDGYKSIARNNHLGTPDPDGVWMTRGEWLTVRDIKSREDARRGK